MTLISCLALGIAFLIAVGLLVFAGILLGWTLPSAIERWRAARGGSRRKRVDRSEPRD